MANLLAGGRVLLTWAQGKKTYIGVLGIIGLAAAQALGYNIPSWVVYLVFGGTIAAHRQSISELADVLKDLGTMVSQPHPLYLPPNVVASIAAAHQVAQQAATQAAQSPAYAQASETEKTDELNESQLSKGN